MPSIRHAALLLASVISIAASASSLASARELSFDERVAAQKAIEQVYWNHRIWPKENPGPKPPLSAVISDEAIRAKVRDYLEKSRALEKWWQRPITGEQLQAELDRMAANTRDSMLLAELFTSLGNDPFIVAETLARQTLAERLIRNWYANDHRFHGELRKRVEAAIVACGDANCMKSMGGNYQETSWKLRSGVSGLNQTSDSHSVVLTSDEWKGRLGDLARTLGAAVESLPTMKLSPLQETAEQFSVQAVLSQSSDEVTIAGVAWRKSSFEIWWAREQSQALARAVEEPSVVYALPSLPLTGCTNDTWSLTTDVDSGTARYHHTAVWTGTEMIVWGGFNRGDNLDLNTGARYNPSTDTWVPISRGPNVPVARQVHTAVWTGTEMIVWGGIDDGHNLLNTGGRYNPSTNAWTPTSTGANVPSARNYHTAVWTGTKMIVWGGYSFGGSNAGAVYSPATDTWTPTSTGVNVPSARWAHTAVWTGTEMIVWGGLNATNTLGLWTGGRYKPATDTWTPTSMGPSARFYHSAVWTGNQMIIWGGGIDDSVSNPMNTGGRYDPTTDTWSPTSTGLNVALARQAHTAVWTGTEMIVWGGSNGIGLNTGGRYNPSTDTWAATSTGVNVPVARQFHTAVWTGTEMIVWGGAPSFGTLNDGGRYNPSADTWTPVATAGSVPAERSGHTAVWTGTEMIVWGGAGEFSYPDVAGRRYNPATDTWTPTSPASNTPNARVSQTAVWTGTEMIIWGGGFNTGDRYNPSTDTWAATSTGVNVPAARYYHTAVWTGTEMIVWGGSNGSGLNTGGRYNPSTNTWAATSTGVNVPAARYYHTAVWTGTEMIVWGGYGAAFLNTGGRYNPAADTWTPTSVGASVPVGRYLHTAVWTGAEMIVWGGFFNGSDINTGGRYNPSTDNWAPTSTAAAVPDPRDGHTTVWTGTEMIVWGGRDSGVNPYLNTGGRYSPSADTWAPTSTASSAPVGRTLHSAVWTGTEMIVWGGAGTLGYLNSGGRYCLAAAGAVPDGGSISVVPLTIDRAGGGLLALHWSHSCGLGDLNYEIYEGALGSFVSHVPILCSTSGALSATVTPTAGNRYYLVVPSTGTVEGSYGQNSRGHERPASASACLPQSVASCP